MEAKNEPIVADHEPFDVTFHGGKIKEVSGTMLLPIISGAVFGHENDIQWTIARAPCCGDHLVVACARKLDNGEVEEHGYMLRLSDMAAQWMKHVITDVDWDELDRLAAEDKKNSDGT